MAAKQKVGKPAIRQQTSTGTHILVSTVNDNVNDNVSDNREITSDDAAEAASDMVNKLRDEIQDLRCTVNTLQQQVEFLLTFVGASNCNPTTIGTGDVIPSVGDGDTSSAATLFRLDDDGARNRQRPTKFQQSQLCQAVTEAVYVDIHSSELKAKNVIITGLAEDEHCTDGTWLPLCFLLSSGNILLLFIHNAWANHAVPLDKSRVHCWCLLTALIQLNVLSPMRKLYENRLMLWCGIICVSIKI